MRRRSVLQNMVMGLTATILAAALTACGNNNSGTPVSEITTAAQANGQADETIELLVSVWAGPHADLQKTISTEFTGGKIVIDDVDYGNLMQKQLTSFQAASGTGNYDVVWVNSQWLKDYVEAGYILPIDEMAAGAGIDMDMYARGLVEDCTFDGRIYGFPTYAQSMILAYDSQVFAEENLKVPETLEELIETAKYFKEKGTGIAIPAKQGGASSTLFSQMLYSDGGDYLDADGNLNLTGDAAVNAARAYQELTRYSVEGCLAWHHDETAEAVRTKSAPIGIIMSGLANQNADPDKSLIVDTVAYAPMPGYSGNAAACNTFWVWAIAANSANQETAFDYCSWMAGTEMEKKQTLADQQISAVNELSEDAEVLAKAPFLPVVMEQLANGKSDPKLKSFAALKEGLIVTLSELATTDADPAAAMAALQEQMKDVDFTK